MPKTPDIQYWGVYEKSLGKPGFYAVSADGSRLYKPISDQDMQGAQCLLPLDFYDLQAYIESLKSRIMQDPD